MAKVECNKGLLDGDTLPIALRHQVGEDLSIGLGGKAMVATLDVPPEGTIVRDDSIMDDGEAVVTGEVRVHVFLRHSPVGCPGG